MGSGMREGVVSACRRLEAVNRGCSWLGDGAVGWCGEGLRR